MFYHLLSHTRSNRSDDVFQQYIDKAIDLNSIIYANGPHRKIRSPQTEPLKISQVIDSCHRNSSIYKVSHHFPFPFAIFGRLVMSFGFSSVQQSRRCSIYETFSIFMRYWHIQSDLESNLSFKSSSTVYKCHASRSMLMMQSQSLLNPIWKTLTSINLPTTWVFPTKWIRIY